MIAPHSARHLRRRRVALVGALVCLGPALLGGSRVARADAVDEAFARGHAAAASGDWDGAVAAYERAATLLPTSSDVLEYDLGTAHAHAGALGPATFHLRRAVRTAGDPGLREAARRNLGVVRRRAELRAETNDVRISPAPDWRDRLWLGLAAPGVGVAGIVLGWLAVALVATRARRRRGTVTAATGTPDDTASARWSLTPAIVATAVAFGVISFAHGLAVRADPEGIVLSETADVRAGPGRHREVSFSLQGGSSVRLVGSAPGWHQIRLTGGLTGWVPSDVIGRLDGVEPAIRRGARARPPAAPDAAATADDGS